MEQNRDTTSILREYLVDAIAAENNYETQMNHMSDQGDNAAVRKIFSDHAAETRLQHQRLTQRLEAVGGKPSGFKSVLAHVFGSLPGVSRSGRDTAEETAHNLVAGYAMKNSEIAMYEMLATIAAVAGDLQTEQLAREIQEEERHMAQKIWHLIAPCSREAMLKISDARERNPNLSRA